MAGTTAVGRQRHRYQILKAQLASSCLNFIIIDHCSAGPIAKREAAAIA